MFRAKLRKPISDEVQSFDFRSRFGPIGDNDDHAIDGSHIQITLFRHEKQFHPGDEFPHDQNESLKR
jgi:hypothetical protein